MNLDIPDAQRLALLLRTTPRELNGVLRRADDFYDELVVHDPRKPDKPRHVVSARGKLRTLQQRFHADVLSTLYRSPHSHGGVRGRSVLTNVAPHLGQRFVFTTDIANFYPSIHRERGARLFAGLGCSVEVARLCTRLCTFRHRLEQGLVTSPALADQLLRPVDDRIAGACAKLGLTYTRFVDDLAISAPFDLDASGIPHLVHTILTEHGFRPHPDKTSFEAVERDASIAGVRFRNGHPDVRRDYVAEVERQLKDAASLAEGGEFVGPYLTESQMRGKVHFVTWVNPGRKRQLFALLKKIDWLKVSEQGRTRGLVANRRKVMAGGK